MSASIREPIHREFTTDTARPAPPTICELSAVLQKITGSKRTLSVWETNANAPQFNLSGICPV
jgi:hypothetical protein